jgi:hypothetical protein
MLGFLSAAAAVIDEEPNQKVHSAQNILIEHRGVSRDFAYDDGGFDRYSAMFHGVSGPAPGTQPRQYGRDVERAVDRHALNAIQAIAGVDIGFGLARRAARRHVERLYAARTVPPYHAVVGEMEPVVLSKVHNRRDTGRQGQDREDRCGQLELEFLKHKICR